MKSKHFYSLSSPLGNVLRLKQSFTDVTIDLEIKTLMCNDRKCSPKQHSNSAHGDKRSSRLPPIAICITHFFPMKAKGRASFHLTTMMSQLYTTNDHPPLASLLQDAIFDPIPQTMIIALFLMIGVDVPSHSKVR